jgi:hypothetical protein
MRFSIHVTVAKLISAVVRGVLCIITIYTYSQKVSTQLLILPAQSKLYVWTQEFLARFFHRITVTPWI